MFGICILSYFLPWISLYDSIGDSDTLTGLELLLATGNVIEAGTVGLPTIWITLAFIMALSGLLYMLVAKKSHSYSGVLSLAGILFLVLFQLGSDYDRPADDVSRMEFLFGYWLQLALLVIAANSDVSQIRTIPSKELAQTVNQVNINIITQIQNSVDQQNKLETPNKQFPADNQFSQ